MDPLPSARSAFSLTIVDPPRRRIWVAALVNVIGESTSMDDGGGSQAVFRRRDSDEVVGEFTQPFSEATSEYTVVLADYSEMSAEDFERTWLKR